MHDRARIALNGLYSAKDYPSVESLKTRYAFGWRILPIPAAGDFRVSLNNAEEAAIRAQIEADMQASLSDATGDLYARLKKAVDAVAERLGSPNAIFRDTLIQNVSDLVDLIPKLNLNNDATLEELRIEVKGALAGLDAQALRDDKAHREDVAAKADAIAAKLGGFMGA